MMNNLLNGNDVNAKEEAKKAIIGILFKKNPDELPPKPSDDIITRAIDKKIQSILSPQQDADQQIDGMQMDADANFDLSLLLDNLSSSGKLRFVSPDVLRKAYLRMMEIGIELAEAGEGIEADQERKREEGRQEFLRSYGDVKLLCDSVEGLRGQDGQDVDIGLEGVEALAAAESLRLAKLYADKMKDIPNANADTSTMLNMPIFKTPTVGDANQQGQDKFDELQVKLVNFREKEEQRKQAELQQAPEHAPQANDLKKGDTTDKKKKEVESSKSTAFKLDNSGASKTSDRIDAITNSFTQAKDAKNRDGQKEALEQMQGLLAYELLARSGMSPKKIEKLLINTDDKSSKSMIAARESIMEKAMSAMVSSGLYNNGGGDLSKAEINPLKGVEKDLNAALDKTSHNMMAQAALGPGFLVRTNANNLPDEGKKRFAAEVAGMKESDRDAALLGALSSDKPGKLTEIWRNIVGPSAETLAKEKETPWLQIGVMALLCPPLLLLYSKEIMNSTPVKVMVGVADAVRITSSSVGVVAGGLLGTATGVVKAAQAEKGKGWEAFKSAVDDHTKGSIANIKRVGGEFAQLPDEVAANKIIKGMEENNKFDRKDGDMDKFIEVAQKKMEDKKPKLQVEPKDLGKEQKKFQELKDQIKGIKQDVRDVKLENCDKLSQESLKKEAQKQQENLKV